MELTTVKEGSGDTVRLWKDKWTLPLVREKYPHLLSFAKDHDSALQNFQNPDEEEIYNHFHLPLSLIADQELADLIGTLHYWSANNDLSSGDTWSFDWNGKYSARRVYEKLDPHDKAPAPFQWIWKSRALPKQKFFFWLLLLDRLNTRDLLARKNFYVESKACVLCQDCQMKLSIIYFSHVISARASGGNWIWNGTMISQGLIYSLMENNGITLKSSKRLFLLDVGV